MIRHIPNAITISRGLCGPVVAWLVWWMDASWAAFWVFLFAICTDMIDGFIARRLDAVSNAALFLDPAADKMLTDFTWTALAAVGYAPIWLVTAVIARDLIVGLVWIARPSHERRFTPRPSGQIGVAFEGIALSVLLFHGPWLDVHWPTVGASIGTVALALSLVQLLEYAVGRSGT